MPTTAAITHITCTTTPTVAGNMPSLLSMFKAMLLVVGALSH